MFVFFVCLFVCVCVCVYMCAVQLKTLNNVAIMCQYASNLYVTILIKTKAIVRVILVTPWTLGKIGIVSNFFLAIG